MSEGHQQVVLANANPVRRFELVEDPLSVLDTARFEHMQRIAQIMAASSLIPDSLSTFTDDNRNKIALPASQVIANCFLVVNQAVRWQMDPFAVAQCVSVVHGRLMYEGKLVAAVLEARVGVSLTYTFGKWDPKTLKVTPGDGEYGELLGVIVSGLRENDEEPVVIEGAVVDWKTTGNNSPWGKAANWKRQLRYRGAREWARAYSPGVMLGVVTDDEMDTLTERREALGGIPSRSVAAAYGQPAPQITQQAAEPKPEPAKAEETPHDPETGEVKEERAAAEEKPKDEGKPEAEQQAQADEGGFPGDKPPPQEGSHTLPSWPAITAGKAPRDIVYHLADVGAGDDGKRQTFKNGKEFSKAGVKGGNPVYEDHAFTDAQMAAMSAPSKGQGSESATEPEQAKTPDVVQTLREGREVESEPAIRTNPEDRRDPAQDEAEEAEKLAAAGQPEAPEEERGGADAVHPSVVEAMVKFTNTVREAESWLQIKAALGGLRVSDGWTQHMDESERNHARLLALDTTQQLVNDGRDPVKPHEDPTFFNLWLMRAEPGQVMPMFTKLVGTEAFRKLGDQTKAALSAAAQKAAGEEV